MRSALASAADGEHDQFLARTQDAGLVGVLVSRSVDGLVVTSVIADESVAPADVHAAAHEVAAAAHDARDPGESSRVSLFDVPLGAGHAWEVRETVEERFTGSPTSEVVDAVLPSWSIGSRHDLAGAPGVREALEVLGVPLSTPRSRRPSSWRRARSPRSGRTGSRRQRCRSISIRATGVPQRTEVRERSATTGLPAVRGGGDRPEPRTRRREPRGHPRPRGCRSGTACRCSAPGWAASPDGRLGGRTGPGTAWAILKTFTLPGTDIVVPNVVLGLMRIADKSDDEIRTLVAAARDAGIAMIDHADIYGGAMHVCERRYAEAMRAYAGSAEGSLSVEVRHRPARRLRLLVRAHRQAGRRIARSARHGLPRPPAPAPPGRAGGAQEVARAFDELEAAGKVRAFGVSNQTPGQIALLKRYIRQPLVVNQLQLSITHSSIIARGVAANMQAEDQSIDRDGGILDYCRLHDITIQARSPFQAGLTGVFLGSPDYPELNAVIDRLASTYDVPAIAIATAWITRHPAQMQVVLGTTSPDRVTGAAQGSDIPLTRRSGTSCSGRRATSSRYTTCAAPRPAGTSPRDRPGPVVPRARGSRPATRPTSSEPDHLHRRVHARRTARTAGFVPPIRAVRAGTTTR